MRESYILERLEKAVYMGFLLDKNSNAYLHKTLKVTINKVSDFISNYNSKISKKGYPICLTLSDTDNYIEVRTLGVYTLLEREGLEEFIKRVEGRINRNLVQACQSNTTRGIDMFDIDLLVELERTGITTMGDNYLAFNYKKYKVNFIHLYDIIGTF